MRSDHRNHRIERRTMMIVMCFFFLTQVGCWEQVSVEWFPQMKWQQAIQAFEVNQWDGRSANFSPPDGTVPIGWGAVVDPSTMTAAEQDAIANPVPATFASLARGKEYFDVNCKTCHGPTGGGDGMLASPNGPIVNVVPIGPGPLGYSLSTIRSDGHIYTTISLGRNRMPNYRRIPPQARWDVINYIRDLNGQGGRS